MTAPRHDTFPISLLIVFIGATVVALAILIMSGQCIEKTTRDGGLVISLSAVIFIFLITVCVTATAYFIVPSEFTPVVVVFNLFLAIVVAVCLCTLAESPNRLYNAVSAHQSIGQAEYERLVAADFGIAYFLGAFIGIGAAAVRHAD